MEEPETKLANEDEMLEQVRQRMAEMQESTITESGAVAFEDLPPELQEELIRRQLPAIPERSRSATKKYATAAKRKQKRKAQRDARKKTRGKYRGR